MNGLRFLVPDFPSTVIPETRTSGKQSAQSRINFLLTNCSEMELSGGEQRSGGDQTYMASHTLTIHMPTSDSETHNAPPPMPLSVQSEDGPDRDAAFLSILKAHESGSQSDTKAITHSGFLGVDSGSDKDAVASAYGPLQSTAGQHMQTRTSFDMTESLLPLGTDMNSDMPSSSTNFAHDSTPVPFFPADSGLGAADGSQFPTTTTIDASLMQSSTASSQIDSQSVTGHVDIIATLQQLSPQAQMQALQMYTQIQAQQQATQTFFTPTSIVQQQTFPEPQTYANTATTGFSISGSLSSMSPSTFASTTTSQAQTPTVAVKTETKAPPVGVPCFGSFFDSMATHEPLGDSSSRFCLRLILVLFAFDFVVFVV